MQEVDRLFVGPRFATVVWASARARKGLISEAQFLAKLEYYARAGFRTKEGSGGPIRHEWGGVYRVAHRTLFRLIGFYEDDTKTSFIALDAFTKRKKKLSKSEKDRIDDVVEAKEKELWRKAGDDNSAGITSSS